ncbi:MAG: TAT-variant-translocated molybdopterin oxidoreductase [Planctomycetota bacterium]
MAQPGEWQKTPDFQELVRREFAAAERDQLGPVDRRRFLQIIGASAALASASACRYEKEELRPFAQRPEGFVPGDRRLFASAFERDGVALPLHVTTIDGRPIKVDGNPAHPASNGASDAQAQAAILEFYDPDRQRAVQAWSGGQGADKTWEDAFAAVSGALAAKKGDGSGVAVLCATSSSPALHAMRQRFAETFPNATWVQWSPLASGNPEAGAAMAAGQTGAAMRLRLHLDRAHVVLSLDADFLGNHPDAVRNRGDFAKLRKPEGEMSRLYAVESRYSQTGANADHRMPLTSGQMAAFLEALEQALSAKGMPGVAPAGAGSLPAGSEAFVTALAEDLWKGRDRAVVVAGDHLAPEVHARVMALNDKLGAIGKTISAHPLPAEVDAPGTAGLTRLAGMMASGSVQALIVLGGNPAYDAPGSLDFAGGLAKVPFKAHLSVYCNETSRACDWFLPMAHFLEAWGDARAFDGSYSVVQPTIEALHGGKSAIEFLSMVLEPAPRSGREIVRAAFDRVSAPMGGGDNLWRQTLRDGRLAGSETGALAVGFSAGSNAKMPAAPGGMELLLYPCPKVADGRFANNGWLQELPDFLSKVTWDNVLLVSVGDASEQGLHTGDLVEVTAGGASVSVPAYVAPGQARGSAALAMGYGRTAAGRIGGDRAQGVDPVGSDVASLRSADAPFLLGGVTVRKTGKTYPLATTQEHHLVEAAGMAAREERLGALVRTGTKEHFDHEPGFAKHETAHHPELVSLWEPHVYEGYKWGMAIDLSTCDGCNACVIACQAENNIPIVGKDQVSRGREMHWIRIDAYFRGEPENPTVAHQPIACAHCENAPCEEVCPVAATIHSDEGLNDMVYNRCVGTRYCGNNCPYKVRRFNYYHYPKRFFGKDPELMGLGNNPAVSVRSRGVMEKCTYCVQRIQEVKIDAHNAGRRIAEGEVKTACQAACPPQAIVFGDLNNPDSAVARLQAGPRSYELLEELNIKPRTQFLARVTNPNPTLVSDTHTESNDGHGH